MQISISSGPFISTNPEHSSSNIKMTHQLIPKHSKLSAKQKLKLLSDLNVEERQLPKINLSDPALLSLKDIQPSDIIKIQRESKTAGTSFYYRLVIEG